MQSGAGAWANTCLGGGVSASVNRIVTIHLGAPHMSANCQVSVRLLSESGQATACVRLLHFIYVEVGRLAANCTGGRQETGGRGW